MNIKMKKVKLPNSDRNIDKNIAPLIFELSKAGIEIFGSGGYELLENPDDGGYGVWIELWSEDDFCKFTDIVAFGEKINSDFYKRIFRSHNESKLNWQLAIIRDNESDYDASITEHLTQKQIHLWYELRFSREDYIRVLEKVKDHNVKNNKNDRAYERFMDYRKQPEKYKYQHKTVKLWNVFYEDYVDIDKNIAPLIDELWEAGIQTSNSCENNTPEMYNYKDTCIWISFQSMEDVKRFMQIVYIGIPRKGTFTNRIIGRSHKFNWEYSYWIDTSYKNRSPKNIFVANDRIRDIEVGHSLRFPGSDYCYVLKNLIEFNKVTNPIDHKYRKLIKSHKELLAKKF